MKNSIPYSLTYLLLICSLLFYGCNKDGKLDTDLSLGEEGIFRGENNKELYKGMVLSEYFPESGDVYRVIETHNNLGASQAKLMKGEKILATLSVVDLINKPTILTKYKMDKVLLLEEEYPLIVTGEKGLAILVNGRFQVAVRSVSPDMDEEEMKQCLLAFDLQSLKELGD
ncbi:hypothetical protein [Algivirga pacifica]|uniref:Uncharacterized protein n=1 Tax=Algivirga pacifica TaxID=1162670 RepID=A0ABP9DND7_9BACT